MLVQDPITGIWNPISSVASPGTVRLTATVLADGSRDGGTRESERSRAVEALLKIAAALVNTQAQTGTVLDRNGVATGLWNYTPGSNSGGGVSSAGVFDGNGVLVRTLWAATFNDPRILNAAAAWDGLLDDGSVAPSGTYTVQVLS